MTQEDLPRLGKLPPQYIFVLNPYSDARFSRCPICEQKMHQRKVPLFIHVDPFNPVVLGYTCRYCPTCDLLIAHQDQLEAQLANLFAAHDPSVIGNDYLVLGTVERKAWREGMKQPRGISDMLANLHDFKEVRTVEYEPGGWYPADASDTAADASDTAADAPDTAADAPDTAAPPTSRPGSRRKGRKKGKGKKRKRR
jgi:hypothetical protein